MDSLLFYRRRLLCWTLSLAVAAAFSTTVVAADQTVYDVGVARSTSRPTIPSGSTASATAARESEGVTQPIWAKAIAIGTDEREAVVLITVDSLGMRLPMVEEVARRLKEKAGIERERFAVTFTHSHTTPKVNGASDTIFSTPIPPDHQAHIDRYTAS